MIGNFKYNQILLKSLLLLVGICLFSACEKKPDATETYSYNSFFVYPEPEEKKVYVGTVTGLSSCKYIVSDYYAKRHKYIKGEWDYICCLRTKESECSEKHRYED